MDEGPNISDVIRTAGESAVTDAQAPAQEPAQAPAQEAAPQQDVQQEAQPDAQPQEPAAQPQVPEYEYQGQRISKNEADQLIALGIEAINQANEMAREAPPGPPPEAQPETPPEVDKTHPIVKRLLENEKRLAQVERERAEERRERQTEGILKEVDGAIDAEESLAKFRADPELKSLVKGMVLLQQYRFPNQKADVAAKNVSRTLTKFMSGEQSKFVVKKVEQASRKVSTGGGVPSAQAKEHGSKEFYDGTVMKQVINQLLGKV